MIDDDNLYTAMTAADAAAAGLLLAKHLRVWGINDAAARCALLKDIYDEEVEVIDPGSVLRGHQEVSDFIGELLTNNPGFAFTQAQAPEIHHHTAILHWRFGPDEDPWKVCGQDIFVFRSGRISRLLIFIDGLSGAGTTSPDAQDH